MNKEQNTPSKKAGRHTILGAGGAIGNCLTHELLSHGHEVRLASRSGYAMEATESVKANIDSYNDTLRAVEGSDIVYLCVGLPYDAKVWKDLWPKIMRNTIDACKKADARLIFFDNVYMYGKTDEKMTETTPYNPCSKKGEIRAAIARQLEEEMEQGNIRAIIARSADFYGPHAAQTSLPYVMALEKLMKGKKAQWMVDAGLLHSYTYTIDCARGLSLLAGSDDAFNQIWHLPTCNPGINGETFIRLAADELGQEASYTVLKKWMIKLGGLFNKTIAELYEMLYQNEMNYHFDSTKFNHYFQYEPTSYEDGIRETIRFFSKR